MSDENVRAHIAALLRLENVGFLLGSGASVGAGGQVVKKLWDEFQVAYAASYQWLLDNHFIKAGEVPNVEALSDILEIAVQEWTRVAAANLDELLIAQRNLKRAVIKAAVLSEEFWKDLPCSEAEMAKLNDHKRLLQKASSSRQPGQAAPWIFTTNYDLAVELAAETINLKITNGFEGLHCRSFSPHNFDLGLRNILARGEARFGTYNVYGGNDAKRRREGAILVGGS